MKVKTEKWHILYVRARRLITRITKEFHEVPEEPKVPDACREEKLRGKMILDRTFEIVSSIKLCDALLDCTADPNNSSFAATTRVYWQLRYAELIPYVAEQIAKTIEQLIDDISRNLERLFQ